MSTPVSATSFEYPLLIVEKHLDTFGHVNNAVYLEILEEARWDLITRNGYGLDHVRKTGMGPTILEIQMKFMRELRLRQNILIKTQLLDYPSKVGTLRQWIENEAGELCFEAIFKFGLFDVRARKLVLPTPEWLQAIGSDLAP